MKKFLIVAGFLLSIGTSQAQVIEKVEEVIIDTMPSNSPKSRKSKIITLSLKGDNVNQEKIVIEIDGKKIKMNGKDIADLKDIDVRINENEIMFNNRGTTFKRFPGQSFGWDEEGPQNFGMQRGVNELRGRLNDSSVQRKMKEIRSKIGSKAFLGIGMEKADNGVKITSITEGSAAEKAGLKENDIVTKINGDEVKKEMDITTVVSANKPGAAVRVEYLRGGKKQTTTAILGERKVEGFPFNESMDNFTFKDFYFEEPLAGAQNFDFNFDMPNDVWNGQASPNGRVFMNNAPKLGIKLKETELENGLEVTFIEENSAAEKAGLTKGDIIIKVNDKAVKNVNEIKGLLKDIKDKPAQITFLRNGKEQTVALKMTKKLKEVSL